MQGEKTRVKVCYVVTKGVWGGAQKYVYTLATNLPEADYDVFAIVGAGGTLKTKLEDAGVRVYELPELKRDISFVSEFNSSLEMLKIIWKEKPDVLHLNSPKASGFGSVAGRLVGTQKIIQTVHGWTFNEHRGVIATMFIRFFSWLTVVLCHQTIVIADREMSQALTMPLVKNKFVLIKNGIASINFKDREVARKELLKLTESYNQEPRTTPLWIGTISELTGNKGLEYAIQAVAKIQTPFIFCIIGEGENRKKLENLISEYNLQNKVFLIGNVDNASQYLKAFDIFTLTSVKEGLPYTILEAGQAGIPVIASSVGGIPEIIENNKSGILVVKTKSGEITRAIEYLITNPNKQTEYGQNLKSKVETEFSLEQMLSKTFALYQ